VEIHDKFPTQCICHPIDTPVSGSYPSSFCFSDFFKGGHFYFRNMILEASEISYRSTRMVLKSQNMQTTVDSIHLLIDVGMDVHAKCNGTSVMDLAKELDRVLFGFVANHEDSVSMIERYIACSRNDCTCCTRNYRCKNSDANSDKRGLLYIDEDI
jgi:hypothetical protein